MTNVIESKLELPGHDTLDSFYVRGPKAVFKRLVCGHFRHPKDNLTHGQDGAMSDEQVFRLFHIIDQRRQNLVENKSGH